MNLEAIAVIKISPADVEAAVASTGHRVVALEDAAALHLGVSITEASPEELAARLRALLGDLLDRHEHPRGVPVYPASYAPEAASFDALVEELGDAAEWIPIVEDEQAHSMAAMAGLLGSAGVDLAALHRQMASGDPNAMMESAMQVAQQLAQSGKLGEVREAMAGMLGGVDPRQMLAQSGIDVGAIEQQFAAMDAAVLERLGISPERMRLALEESGGDVGAALQKLGVIAPGEGGEE